MVKKGKGPTKNNRDVKKDSPKKTPQTPRLSGNPSSLKLNKPLDPIPEIVAEPKLQRKPSLIPKYNGAPRTIRLGETPGSIPKEVVAPKPTKLSNVFKLHIQSPKFLGTKTQSTKAPSTVPELNTHGDGSQKQSKPSSDLPVTKLQAKKSNSQMHASGDSEDHKVNEDLLEISNRNKLKVLEVEEKKLLDMQSIFKARSESLKRSYTSISLAQKRNSQFVVNVEHLSLLPTNLPIQEIETLINNITERLNRRLDFLSQNLMNLTIPENEMYWRFDLQSIHNKLAEYHRCEINQIMEVMGEFCKQPSGRTELEIVRSGFINVKAERTRNQVALIAEHQVNLAKNIESCDQTISKLSKEDRDYGKQLKNPKKVTLSDNEEEVNLSNNKVNNLAHEIEELENCLQELKNEEQQVQDKVKLLQELMENLESNRAEIGQLQEKIAELSRTSNVSPRRAQCEANEIELLKWKLKRSERKMKSYEKELVCLKKLLVGNTEMMISLNSKKTELCAQRETVKHDILKSESIVDQLATDTNNQSRLCCSLGFQLLTYQRQAPLNKSLLETHKKLDEKGYKFIALRNIKIKMKTERIAQLEEEICSQLQKNFKTLTLAEITSLNLHEPNCKYSKQNQLN